MILLATGSTKGVELSLTEKSTLQNPYYLFRFINDSSNESTYFTATDVSSFPSRYNKFMITLTGGTQNLSAGTLSNMHMGTYKYEVYEQVAQYNFDLTGTTSMVESGKVLISGSTATLSNTNSVTYTANTNTTKVVYFR
jgi:hypothetical protein